MATIDGFYRMTGKPNFKRFLKKSSITMAIGDLVEFSEASGRVTVHTGADEVLGVVLEASASTSTAPVLVDIIGAGDVFQAKVETGTMAAVEIGDEADINSEDGITLTESDNDCLLVGWNGTTTDMAFVIFKNLAYGAA